jgi:hypothetical protein
LLAVVLTVVLASNCPPALNQRLEHASDLVRLDYLDADAVLESHAAG